MTPQEINLTPGELWFGGGDVRVRTLLGSCVAVTVWHPRRRLGGMCHYMLPERTGVRGAKGDGRFAGDALDWLVRRMIETGSRPCEYEAKLFGGGRMFELAPGARVDGVTDIHGRNAAAARSLAAHYGLCVRGEHLGGSGHRQVVFELPTGDAWVRHTPLRQTLDRAQTPEVA